MTLAVCQEGSRSDDFVNYLSAAAIYFFEDGNLFIDLVADGGTMKFMAAGAATAEDSGTGGAEAPAEEAPPKHQLKKRPKHQRKKRPKHQLKKRPKHQLKKRPKHQLKKMPKHRLKEAEEAAVAPAEEAGRDHQLMIRALTGVVWQWTEFTDPVQGMISVDNPELYTTEFLPDGSVNVQADCNSGRGNYTADGSNITISELAMTRALCTPDSLSDDFVNYLTARLQSTSLKRPIFSLTCLLTVEP